MSEKKNLLKDKSLKLLEESTTHGVPKLVLTTRVLIRLLWSIFLTFSIAFCSYMISRNISDFFGFDVVTKIKQEESNPAIFPTVTICNINSFIKNGSLELMYKMIAKVKNVSLDEAMQIEYLDGDDVFATIDNFKIQAKNPAFGDENRRALGYTIEEILISCTFNYKDCDENDFEWWYSMEYGNCFRFNSGKDKFGNEVPLKKVDSPGYDTGLTLELFPGSTKNYISRLNNGINIFVDDYTIYPLYYEGADCNVGQMSNVKITKRIHKKMPAPYSDCQDAKTFDSLLISEIKKLNQTYRHKDCLLMCYNKMTIEKCACYDAYFQGILGAPPCLTLEEIACVADSYLNFLNIDATKVCIDLCPLDCEVTNYDIKMSYSRYPSSSHVNVVKKNPKIIKHLNTENVTIDMLKKSLLGIRLYYADMSYVAITEYPKTQLVDVIASVGGLLGLFLGMSVLSFVEYIRITVKIITILLIEKVKNKTALEEYNKEQELTIVEKF